ncbi:MAG: caspase family protein [Puia sp.]|nr:caspase family protein [Puia sp.]
MANVGILIGNTDYQKLGKLDCCREDVSAMEELLEATKEFDSLELIVNVDSFQLKERIRAVIDGQKDIQEIFFYFSGHGYQRESDFFFCATNFDQKRPNETGLSISELHTLLRAPEADLVVTVIDACNSGSLLVKSEGSFLPATKQGFKNLIQIASCLDSQNSLTGDPLSLFTERFRTAALRKSEGAVYYTDIIDALRDEFLDNNDQTPHFVSQGTGREQFVGDAARLDDLRKRLLAGANPAETPADISLATSRTPTAMEVLERAEQQFASVTVAQNFISALFDALAQRASRSSSTSDLFSWEIVTHSDFLEPTSKPFIARALSGEKRPDNFVTAAVTYPTDRFGIASIASIMGGPSLQATYQLTLNCSLDKAQVKITLTPKFVSLKQLVLVVTCAPSLQTCYVFEILTQHSLRDWGIYDVDGEEIVRRWYKRNWTDSADLLADGIWEKIEDAAQECIDTAIQALQTKVPSPPLQSA